MEAPRVARSSPALRGEDEMIDFVGWWGSGAAGVPLDAARLARGRPLRAGLRRRGRDRARPRHDGAAVLHAPVLARVQRHARLRRVRPAAARARRTAQAAAAGGGRPRGRLRDHLRVPARVRRGGAGPICALAARLAAAGRDRRARRRPGARGRRGDRAPAALQPRGLPLVDAPRLLEHPAAETRLLRHLGSEPPRVRDAPARLARAARDLAGARDGSARHRAALPARAPRRGADDRGRLRLLLDLQLAATTCRSAAARRARAS